MARAGLTLDLRSDPAAGAADRSISAGSARAIGHLLDNAIAATSPGGKILVDLARARAAARRIVISDNGAGMDTTELARALGGFKLALEGKTIERRQGLGLPLARQLIEAHGGKLEAGVGERRRHDCEHHSAVTQ